MLSREELKNIAGLKGNGSYFVSLYLNVSPVTNPRGEYAILFKNMVKEVMGSLSRDVMRRVKYDLSRIDACILSDKRDFKKGLSILSSSENSFWQEYHLSVPFKNELIVDKTPYIKPLLDIIDNYERYAVLLVDKESARIFVVHLGEITEYGEVHTPDIPGRHKKGGWFALSQNHYERHINYHIGLHLKDVVKKLESFLKGEYIGKLIMGGSPEAVLKTKELLQKTVIEKVIGSFQAGMFEKNTELLKKVEPVLTSFERQEQEETVRELIIRARKNEKAVSGIDDVLLAVQEGKVMKLIFLRDIMYSGYSCRGCKALFSEQIKTCPYCNGEMSAVSYLVDLIAQKAVQDGAVVEVIGESKELEKYGGIGAFLRF